jgi:DNA adenine methylase
MKRLRQLFTYPGTKFGLAPKFVPLIVPHRHFVSLCGGTAAEFAFKEPSRIETYNDKDGWVHNTLREIRDECEPLAELIANTPNGRQQYLECRRILDDPPEKHSPLRRAWAFLICGNICYHGVHPSITRSWSTSCASYDKSTGRLLALPKWIKDWRDRLRRVRLENDDWRNVLLRYDRYDTFHFFDPPYFPLTLTTSGRLYSYELSVKDHEQMLRTIINAKGYMMLCGYNHPLYLAHLFHWRKVEFPARASMGRQGARRCEVIWMNYEEDGSKISRNKLLLTKRYVEVVGDICSARRYIDRSVALMDLPKSSDVPPVPRKKPKWLDYANDGRSLASTKLMIAMHYIAVMGSVSAAQRWLDRLETLLALSK